MTHDYKRHGTTTLFAALDVLADTVIGQCLPRHRHTEFLKFLKMIDREVPRGHDLRPLAREICTRYRTEFPDEQKRYGSLCGGRSDRPAPRSPPRRSRPGESGPTIVGGRHHGLTGSRKSILLGAERPRL